MWTIAEAAGGTRPSRGRETPPTCSTEERGNRREGEKVEDNTKDTGKAVLRVWVGGWVSRWVEHLERIREEKGGDGQSRVQQEEGEMRVKGKRARRLEEGPRAGFLSLARTPGEGKNTSTWMAKAPCGSK